MNNTKQPTDMPIKLASGKTEFAIAINPITNKGTVMMIPRSAIYEPIMAICGQLGYYDINLLAN